MGAGDIPDRQAKHTTIDAHVHAQRPGAVAIAAVQEEAELHAVCVVLTQRLQQQLGPLPWSMLGRVHHQVGPWREREREGVRERKTITGETQAS